MNLRLKRGRRDMSSESFSKSNVALLLLWSVLAVARLIKLFYRIPLFLAAAVVITGCAAILPKVPPLASEGTSIPGKVFWHDLVTPELVKARLFYGGVVEVSVVVVWVGCGRGGHYGGLWGGVW